MAADNETGQLDGSSLPAAAKKIKQSDANVTSASVAADSENPAADEKLIEMLRNAPFKGEDPLIGTTLGERFRVESVLGAGGMSVVYRATQLVVDRPVAIKTLHIRLHAMQGATERFQREIKTLCKLSHPNIVTVYDCLFSEAGQPFVIMDMLKGRSLDEIIKSEGPIPPERAQKIFLQICKGLEHAHRNAVIHRDLKPGNVMLLEDSDDFVKVVDFGLAKIGEDEFKLTRSGEVWGSPIYMSPEQCRAQGCDARSDVYSLGVLMYETLTGKPPFSAGNLYEIYKGHITEPPQPFSTVSPGIQVPSNFEKLVMRALAKDPGDRFQSMTEVKDELRTIYAGNYDDSNSPSGNRIAQALNSSRADAVAPSVIESNRSNVESIPSSASSQPIPTVVIVAAGALVSMGVASLFLFSQPSNNAMTNKHRPEPVGIAVPDSLIPLPNSTNATNATKISAPPQAVQNSQSPSVKPAKTSLNELKPDQPHAGPHKVLKIVERKPVRPEARFQHVDAKAQPRDGKSPGAVAPKHSQSRPEQDQWAALRAEHSRD